MRTLLPLILGLGAVACSGSPDAPPADQPQPPAEQPAEQPVAQTAGCPDCNVVFIVIDATRADYFGSYGFPAETTPNMDKLAERGMLFEHAFAQAPATLPSVSSYMTGRYRLATGMDFTLFKANELYHPMTDAVTTIAEVLGEHGHATVGAIANVVIAKGVDFDLNVHQGFDVYDFGDDPTTTARTLELLEQNKDKPFFLYTHLMGPHAPNLPADGFEDRRGSYAADLPQPTAPNYSQVDHKKLELSDKAAEFWKAAYADSLMTADARVGEMLAKIDELGLTDETLVIITADHGEGLGDPFGKNIRWGHGYGLKPPVLHVPLIIAGPGVPAGERAADQVAELVDLAPTITSFLGIEVKDEWQWDGEPLFGPDAVKGSYSISDQGIPPEIATNIRTSTHTVSAHFSNGKARNYRFFELETDPDENVGGVNKAGHTDLKTALDNYMATVKAPELGEATQAPSDETMQQLDALGYTE